MPSLRIWALASRPKTLCASISPVLLGTALAYRSHRFCFWTFLFTFGTALGIQITTNFVNDYQDFLKGADTVQRKGPIRITQKGLVSLPQMKQMILALFLVTSLCGLYLVFAGGIYIAGLLAIALALAALYTAGPFPLAYLGLGDLFVFIFFGPVAVLGAYFLQTHSLSWEGLYAGCSVGALSTAILCINNLRDIDEDKQAGKKTLAVRWGRGFAKAEYVGCIALAGVFHGMHCRWHPSTLLCYLYLIPASFCITSIFSYQDPRQLNVTLAKTSLSLFLYTVLLCLGWIIL